MGIFRFMNGTGIAMIDTQKSAQLFEDIYNCVFEVMV